MRPSVTWPFYLISWKFDCSLKTVGIIFIVVYIGLSFYLSVTALERKTYFVIGEWGANGGGNSNGLRESSMLSFAWKHCEMLQKYLGGIGGLMTDSNRVPIENKSCNYNYKAVTSCSVLSPEDFQLRCINYTRNLASVYMRWLLIWGLTYKNNWADLYAFMYVCAYCHQPLVSMLTFRLHTLQSLYNAYKLCWNHSLKAFSVLLTHCLECLQVIQNENLS